MDPPTHDVSIGYNNDRREDQLYHLLRVLRSYLPVLGKVLAGLLRPVCFKVPRHSVKFPPHPRSILSKGPVEINQGGKPYHFSRVINR